MNISNLQRSGQRRATCAGLLLIMLAAALHSCSSNASAEAKTLYVYVDIEGTLRSTVFERADGTLDFVNSTALLYPHAPNRSTEGLPAGRRQVPAVRNWLGQPPLALPFVAYEGARLADLPHDAEGVAVVPPAEEAKQPFGGYVSSVTNPQLTALSAPRLNALRQRVAQRRGLADLRASGAVTDADYMLQWQMNSECPPAPEQPDLVASQQPCDPSAHYVDGMLAVSFSKVDGRIRREAMLQQPFYYALRDRDTSGSYLNRSTYEACWVRYVPEMQRYVWVGDDYGIYAFDMATEQGRRIAHFHYNASAPGASPETLAYAYDEPEQLYFFNPHVSPLSDVRMPSEAAAQQAQQRTGFMYLGVYVGSERALAEAQDADEGKAACRVHIVRIAYNLDGATEEELAEPQHVVVAHAGLHCYNTEDQEAQSDFPYAVAGFHFRMLELDEAAENDLGDTSTPPDYDSTTPGPSAAPGSPVPSGQPGATDPPSSAGGGAAAVRAIVITPLALAVLLLCATL